MATSGRRLSCAPSMSANEASGAIPLPASPAMAQVSTSSAPPSHTATFDLGLLGALLNEAVEISGLAVHLESSPDDTEKAAWASWSAAVAAFLDSRGYSFNIADPSVAGISYRLKVDSSFVTAYIGAGPMVVVEVMFFTPTTIVGLSTGVPDIQIDAFSVSLTLTFDGVLTPTCYVQLSSKFAEDLFRDEVMQKITSALEGITPQQVRSKIDWFFRLLMRLGAQAQIDGVQGYDSDGTTLTVNYTLPPELALTDPVHSAGTL